MRWLDGLLRRRARPEYSLQPDQRFCWCDSGTLHFTGRNHSGAPYPHVHSDTARGEAHFWRELTDEEWAVAMGDTPYRDELTAERDAAHADDHIRA